MDARALGMTGVGRKRTQVGRKNPSDTKGGRKNGLFPYPPLCFNFVRSDTFLYVFSLSDFLP
jgi:hypothetical protein